jgi:hypothetical protein
MKWQSYGLTMKKITTILLTFCTLMVVSHSTMAALYTSEYGDVLANVSNCDDCFDGPISFGTGHDINFYGTTYADFFVGSNGYVTFGSGSNDYVSVPLDIQAINPMIAGLFTDLDSRSDAGSVIYANTSVPGEIIVTFIMLGHYDRNYTVRSTFQLVIRSDSLTVNPGEGQIGFFYGDISDTAAASGGFGDGLVDVNPGEVALFSLTPANEQSNAAPRWFNLNGGQPVDVDFETSPIPTLSWIGALLLAGLFGAFGLFGLGRQRSAP